MLLVHHLHLHLLLLLHLVEGLLLRRWHRFGALRPHPAPGEHRLCSLRKLHIVLNLLRLETATRPIVHLVSVVSSDLVGLVVGARDLVRVRLAVLVGASQLVEIHHGVSAVVGTRSLICV